MKMQECYMIKLVIDKLIKPRRNGDIEYIHSLSVYEELKKYNFDDYVCQLGLLHDIIEDTDIDKEYLETHFGKEIANGVDNLTHYEDSESLQEYLIKATKDYNGLVIKLIDRLNNMNTTGLEFGISANSIERSAFKTLNVYLPVFRNSIDRLGIECLLGENGNAKLIFVDKLIKQIEDRAFELQGDL